MDVEDVPVTYPGIIGCNDVETHKMEFIKADGTTKVKLEFPIYDDQPNMEILLKLIKASRKLWMPMIGLLYLAKQRCMTVSNIVWTVMLMIHGTR